MLYLYLHKDHNMRGRHINDTMADKSLCLQEVQPGGVATSEIWYQISVKRISHHNLSSTNQGMGETWNQYLVFKNTAMFSAVSLVGLYIWYMHRDRSSKTVGKVHVKDNSGLKTIPKVPGAIPIFGHALAYARNPRRFFDECKRKYGVPFEINLFGTRTVIIDGHYRDEFYQASEKFLRYY